MVVQLKKALFLPIFLVFSPLINAAEIPEQANSSSDADASYSCLEMESYKEFNDPLSPLIPLGDSFTEFKKWCMDNEVKFAPYLQNKILRNVSAAHLKKYGGQKTQDEYHLRFKNLVMYTLWRLQNNMTGAKLDQRTFQNLIEALGVGRREIARKNSPTAKIIRMGIRRTKSKSSRFAILIPEASSQNENLQQILATTNPKLRVSYLHYGKRLCSNLNKHKAYGYCIQDADSNELILCSWDKDKKRTSFELKVKSLMNTQVALPILTKAFNDALEAKQSTDILTEKIAHFHWYWALVCYFIRGSASIGEMLTDALWLFHGYNPPVPKNFINPNTQEEKRLAPDLEALVPEDDTCLILSAWNEAGHPTKIIRATKSAQDEYAKNYLNIFQVQPQPLALINQWEDAMEYQNNFGE